MVKNTRDVTVFCTDCGAFFFARFGGAQPAPAFFCCPACGRPDRPDKFAGVLVYAYGDIENFQAVIVPRAVDLATSLYVHSITGPYPIQ